MSPPFKAFAELLAALRDGIVRFDRERVADLIRDILPALLDSGVVPGAGEAEELMALLRKERAFAEMRAAGDTLARVGFRTRTFRRHYGQALIELGMLDAAEAILARLEAETPRDHKEYAEVVGLRGRVLKQAFVETPAKAGAHRRFYLRQALTHYRRAYESDPEANLWPGVNLVALLVRAEKEDLVPLPSYFDPRVLAGEILVRFEKMEALQHWDLATAAEACLALAGKEMEAVERMREYCAHEKVGAFALASTLRQLREVWQLDATTTPGKYLLPLLESSLLTRDSGALEVSLEAPREETKSGLGFGEAAVRDRGAAATEGEFQNVLGQDYYQDILWYEKGLERAGSVARIMDGFEGIGTGFLVKGADLHEDWKDHGLLLVTNAHVVSNIEEEQRLGSKAIEEVTIQFQIAKGTEVEFEPEKILWSSSRYEHDVTVLQVKDLPQDLAPVPLARGLGAGRQRVYIIGHPKGGSLSFSLNDNLLKGFDQPDPKNSHYLFYRAPTEGGSSGSPVFNRAWQVIGLHHYGSRKPIKISGERLDEVANEGIVFKSIQRAIAAWLADHAQP